MKKTVEMVAGGVAYWGRAIPTNHDLRILTYETDILTKLRIEGESEAMCFRSVYVGMDEVDVNGSTPNGFGNVRLEHNVSGDLLLGTVKWFMVNGHDRGTFTFSTGTGRWSGVTGTVNVSLDFFSRDPVNEPLNSGRPLVGLALIEGSGIIILP